MPELDPILDARLVNPTAAAPAVALGHLTSTMADYVVRTVPWC